MSPGARRWVVLAAAVLGMLLTARLGWWQLSRAAEKQARQATLQARAGAPALDAAALARDAAAAPSQHYRRVRLQGRWIAGRTVFLDNRPMQGRTGFYVVTPLALGDGAESVLVQRGWVPRDPADRTRLPTLPQTAGIVEVEGLIAPPPGRLYELGADARGPIRQNLDPEDYALETGLQLLPVSVLQVDVPGRSDDSLQRDWPPPAVDVHKHYGYAFQWFALAALIMGLYVWFQLVRPRLRPRA